MTELPAELNKLIADDRRLAFNLWTQPAAEQAKALVSFNCSHAGIGFGSGGA